MTAKAFETRPMYAILHQSKKDPLTLWGVVLMPPIAVPTKYWVKLEVDIDETDDSTFFRLEMRPK